MDTGSLVRQLRAAGADVEITDSGLLLDDARARIVTMAKRSPSPSDLRRIAGASGARAGTRTELTVVHAARASAGAIAWVQAHPEVALVLQDRVVLDGEVRELVSSTPAARRAKGPRPYARFATARVLLSGASRGDQIRLAALAGTTQGSISNALRRIPETRDPGAAFDELVREYPGPGGQEFYWWSSKPLHEQAQLLEAHGAALSGDFAADQIAPWRRPEHLVAYVNAPVDLAAAGYVLAEPDDHTALVVVPADQTLRATATAWGMAGTTDPIIAAYDVLRTATTGDQDEAVDKLRDVVVQRFAETPHG